MEQKYNGAVVVGGGPVGAITAYTAVENGLELMILEEDRAIGHPIQCAGIVSTRTIQESGLNHDNYILNEVRGAIIHSPNGEKICISRPETQAYIIDRAQFDQRLIEKAVMAGAELKLGWRAINWDGSKLKVSTPEGIREIYPEVVVGADGVKSTIRRTKGLPGPKKFLSGAQLTLTGVQVEDPEFVQLFLGEKIAPGFFGWSIPIDEKTVRIGLCLDPKKAQKPANKYLENLIKKHPALKQYSGSELEWNYGAVPIGYPKKLVGDKTIIVGDAAGQVKPTTGGGVYTGMYCGKIAGETINKYIDGRTSLKKYDIDWRKELGRELQIGLAIHNSLGSLSDNEIDDVIKKLDNPRLINAIESHGDMDYPSKVAYQILKTKPSLIKYFGVFATKFLGEML
ncbi:NAD(P)/FAD-dependent oxidoreductase [Methanonatronarchaeum sp. AMET-Sl]|uniref:NAD(P)/FAD-dependent oxidoreductase n=1 Tax=Methanonatronarchaeum sp. AMET-Sl TaxID=3037654 RepID=UPI00244E1DFD|nr:NAD(P)/FAD-dependent oxidoreductase [Methanonatronarchaeum sp. AMET-Sl]WGI17525.1 NAD(P)/FAD-dependent oxidoreductase [Methanonatronarchaeum sp. AMET-Sl]